MAYTTLTCVLWRRAHHMAPIGVRREEIQSLTTATSKKLFQKAELNFDGQLDDS